MSSLSDQEVIEQRNDLEMMRRPHLWPGGLLPLKRTSATGQFPELGYISVGSPILYHGSVFMPDGTSQLYDSFAAIVADGWRVD